MPTRYPPAPAAAAAGSRTLHRVFHGDDFATQQSFWPATAAPGGPAATPLQPLAGVAATQACDFSNARPVLVNCATSGSPMSQRTLMTATQLLDQQHESKQQATHKLGHSDVDRITNKLKAIPEARKVQPNFANKIVRDVGPGVVRVDIKKHINAPSGGGIFDMLFGGGGQQRSQVVAGTGSGFCIDPKGVLLTNLHVVDGADSVTVRFASGQSYEGDVVGADDELDLAVVQLRIGGSTSLPCVQLGRSSTVRQREAQCPPRNIASHDSE
jgi:S1-C subfamily serine protease